MAHRANGVIKDTQTARDYRRAFESFDSGDIGAGTDSLLSAIRRTNEYRALDAEGRSQYEFNVRNTISKVADIADKPIDKALEGAVPGPRTIPSGPATSMAGAAEAAYKSEPREMTADERAAGVMEADRMYGPRPPEAQTIPETKPAETPAQASGTPEWTPRGTHADIPTLIESALARKSGNDLWVDYAPVGDVEAAKIKESTGLDVNGYTHSVDESAIRHIVRRHGPDGEVTTTTPILPQDIAKIPEIISSPDEILQGDATGEGLQRIVYKKRFNGTDIYIEEVRVGRQKLAAKTMWKEPATIESGDLGHTSETLLPQEQALHAAGTDINYTTNPEVANPQSREQGTGNREQVGQYAEPAAGTPESVLAANPAISEAPVPRKMGFSKGPKASVPPTGSGHGFEEGVLPGIEGRVPTMPETGPSTPLRTGKTWADPGVVKGDRVMEGSEVKPAIFTQPEPIEISRERPVRLSDAVKQLDEALAPIRVGGFQKFTVEGKKILGIAKTKQGVIRVGKANDIPVVGHEVGHIIQKMFWPTKFAETFGVIVPTHVGVNRGCRTC